MYRATARELEPSAKWQHRRFLGLRLLTYSLFSQLQAAFIERSICETPDSPDKSAYYLQNQVDKTSPQDTRREIPAQEYLLKILPFQCLLIGKGRN